MHKKTTIRARREGLDRSPLSSSPAGRHAPRYRGYGELLDALLTLQAKGARPSQLGETVEGEPIFCLEVGPEEAERLSLVIAGLHAMEWIGVEVGLTLFTRLVASPPRDRRVLYVPVVNVDGYLRVEERLRAGRGWFYVRANARGVDLNRNWPTHYRRRNLWGRLFPWLGTAGEGPLSEPEVAAICRRLDAEWEETPIDRALSLHSFGRMVLTPWGGRLRRPAAQEGLLGAARSVKAAAAPVPYRVRQVSRWWPGFSAHGLEIDHLHERYQALALLLECSRGGFRPLEPSSWAAPFRWYNPPDPVGECAALAPGLERFLLPERSLEVTPRPSEGARTDRGAPAYTPTSRLRGSARGSAPPPDEPRPHGRGD